MADLDTIFKALRLIPDFDGNPNVLTRFIKLCDQIVAQYTKEQNELINLALINGILNKVIGPAARLINANGIPNDWLGIRNALINNFADQRDETALYNDLALLTQGHSSPQEFYERCQSLFSTVMTYVSLHDTLQSTINAKRDLYKKLTLQAFLRGLKDPLGSRIRCMRPPSIEKALEFVHEESNTMYMQYRNDHSLYRKPEQKVPVPFNFRPPMPQPLHTPLHAFNTNLPGPSRPYQPSKPQMPQLPSPNQFKLPINPSMPTRTQQMFSAPPPNYRQQSAVFRMPPRHQPPFQGPKPMSGVSHFVSKPLPPSGWNWAKQGNPPPSNYFKSRDINMHECSNYDYDYYEQYGYPEYNYCEDYYDQHFNTYPYGPTYEYDPTQTSDLNNEYEPQTIEDQSPPSTEEDFQNAPKSGKLK